MAKSEHEILNDILALIRKEGSPFTSGYTRITSNVQSRLHGDHKVPKEDHWYVIRSAGNNESARRIERILIEVHGTEGSIGSGDQDSTIVYSYRKTAITNP